MLFPGLPLSPYCCILSTKHTRVRQVVYTTVYILNLFVSGRAQYNGFNPVTGQEYRPPAPHAHHVPTVTGANIDHDPLLQHGSDHADRSAIMTWKQPRPSPAGQDFGEQRQTQTEHIQEMRKGRIMNEGLAHVKSTSVRDCLQRP